jgi:hypothetical protein
MTVVVTPLDFLEAVYLNEELPLTVRMRAAIECLQYKHPKLSAAAIGHFDGANFAQALERCIERSKGPPMLNGPVEPIDASEMKRPFPRHYRRFQTTFFLRSAGCGLVRRKW